MEQPDAPDLAGLTNRRGVNGPSSGEAVQVWPRQSTVSFRPANGRADPDGEASGSLGDKIASFAERAIPRGTDHCRWLDGGVLHAP